MKTGVKLGIFLLFGAAAVACSSSSGNGTGGGGHTSSSSDKSSSSGKGSSSGHTSGASSSSSSSGTTTHDGGLDSGTTPVNCTDMASSYCTKFKACAPDIYAYTYENDQICKEVTADGCLHPMANSPFVDPAGCAAAQAASTCPATFSTMGVAACAPKTGTGTYSGTTPSYCATRAACVAGSACKKNPSSGFGTAACPNGTCYKATAAGQACGDSDSVNTTGNMDGLDECDTYAGYACRWAMNTSSTGGAIIGPIQSSGTGSNTTTVSATCMKLVYNAAGGWCDPATDQQCGAGTYCATSTHKCTAYLEDQTTTCTTAGGSDHLCDPKKFTGGTNGCANSPGATAPTCQLRHVVPIGGTPGLHTDDSYTYSCSAYAYTDATSNKCAALAAPTDVTLTYTGFTQTCNVTTTGDNCWPMDPKTNAALKCIGSTCTDQDAGIACP